jgi:glycosyltransferase involved in cell wall biosynthesis
MRVLHLSDDGLPDWRVEKAALTGEKNGFDLFFGGRLGSNDHSTIFSKVHHIQWTAGAMIGVPHLFNRVKKQIKQLVNQVRPDIVHSHNIGSAKISQELGLPFVFDDHEYFGMLSLVNAENLKLQDTQRGSRFRKLVSDMKSSFVLRRSISNWTKWEREIISSVPTITVSEAIAQDLKKLDPGSTKQIFVVPNFPSEAETIGLNKPEFHEKISCVYAGGDSKNKQAINRDIKGIDNLFMTRDIGNLTVIGWEPESSQNFKATGFIPRDQMFSEMKQNSIGLIPWKKHWSHSYLNPNKAYEYAHAGLFVMLTSDLTSVVHTLEENCLTFEDYEDLALKLQYFKSNIEELYKKRIDTFNHARNYLTWEKYEKNIIDAYKSV